MIEGIPEIIIVLLIFGITIVCLTVIDNPRLQNLSRPSWSSVNKFVVPFGIFLAISYALWLVTGLTMNDKEPFSSDQARVIYETLSIASYGTTIVVTSTVVFLPLLTLIWTNAKWPLVNHLDQLALLQRNTLTPEKQALEQKIEDLRLDVDLITREGKRWKFLYNHAVFDIVLIIGAFGFINMVRMKPLTCYRFAVVLNGLAAVAFLLLLSLWGIFQVRIRPIVVKYEGTGWRILGK